MYCDIKSDEINPKLLCIAFFAIQKKKKAKHLQGCVKMVKIWCAGYTSDKINVLEKKSIMAAVES